MVLLEPKLASTVSFRPEIVDFDFDRTGSWWCLSYSDRSCGSGSVHIIEDLIGLYRNVVSGSRLAQEDKGQPAGQMFDRLLLGGFHEQPFNHVWTLPAHPSEAHLQHGSGTADGYRSGYGQVSTGYLQLYDKLGFHCLIVYHECGPIVLSGEQFQFYYALFCYAKKKTRNVQICRITSRRYTNIFYISGFEGSNLVSSAAAGPAPVYDIIYATRKDYCK